MCQAHGNHIGKCPRCAFLRPKNEMSKSKIENAKIENSKNPRLPSEESAEHPTLPLPVRGRCPIFMVRSTLLFLLLQKFWGTLKGVQGPPTFCVFSCLQCWIWKLFCRPFSTTFRSILAMITYFNFTDSIFEMVSKSASSNSKN